MDCMAAGQVLLSHTLEDTIEGTTESFICKIIKHNVCQSNIKLLLPC